MKTLKTSLREMKNIYVLAAIAMLLAMRIVLGIFSNYSLAMFGNAVKLSLSFLPIAMAGAMYGPVASALVGAMGDVISYMLAPAPGGYFPGFSVSAVLTGLIFGFLLYKNQVALPRVIIAWAVNMLCVETFLSAFWLVTLYGWPYAETLTARFISVGIKCVPEIVLIYFTGKLVKRLEKQLGSSKK